MRKFCVVLLLGAIASAPAWSDAFFGIDFGLGDLDINSVTVAPGFDLNSTADSTAIYHLTGGYEFENGFRIIGAFEEFDSIDLFGFGDAVELQAFKIGSGFAVSASERFRVTGAIGIAAWDLEARESFLFNSGPEATGGIDDNDIYFDLGGEWIVNEALSVPFTFNYNNYDFGDATAWRVGVRFHFQ